MLATQIESITPQLNLSCLIRRTMHTSIRLCNCITRLADIIEVLRVARPDLLVAHDPKRSALSCVVVEGSWRVPIEVFFEIRPAQQTYEIAKPLVRALLSRLVVITLYSGNSGNLRPSELPSCLISSVLESAQLGEHHAAWPARAPSQRGNRSENGPLPASWRRR